MPERRYDGLSKPAHVSLSFAFVLYIDHNNMLRIKDEKMCFFAAQLWVTGTHG